MGELLLVDIGSNATRLSLARVDSDTGFRILRHERVQTRLGSGRRGRLPREAIARTLRAIHRFLAQIRHRRSGGAGPRVVAVATAAVREAVNRTQLLEPLRRREGIEVRVLSGVEEGRLGALAVLRSLPLRNGVVVDLGGGSLQITRVHGRRVVSVRSVPLGAVRLTRRFLRHDPPRPSELTALRRKVRAELHGRLPLAGAAHKLVGLGGTVQALARIHLAQWRPRAARHGLCVRRSDITALCELLGALPLRKRKTLRGLKAERADIIVAGAITIEELMTSGGYASLIVSSARVHDGILWHEALNGRIHTR